MEQRTHGLILRTRLLTESSLIVHWLSPDAGRVATVAKGARRPKSPFHGRLDLFYWSDFTVRRSRRSDLHLLLEVRVRQTFPRLRRDWQALALAAYAAALIEQNTETDTPLPDCFQLLLDLLEFASQEKQVSLAVPAFEVKFLDVFGLWPDCASLPVTRPAQALLQELNRAPWAELSNLAVPSAVLQEIHAFLGNHLGHQFGRIPRIRPSL